MQSKSLACLSYLLLIGYPMGTQHWVWVEGGNPEPSAGSRFWTQTRTQPGPGPGWVRVLLGRAE